MKHIMKTFNSKIKYSFFSNSVPLISIIFHYVLSGIYKFNLTVYILYGIFVILIFTLINKHRIITLKIKFFYIVSAIISVLFFFLKAGFFISYDRFIFFVIMFNINLILILLLSNRLKTIYILYILLCTGTIFSISFLYANELFIARTLPLKLRTISYEEENIAEIISKDILKSIDEAEMADKLLSGRTKNISYELYKNSIASVFQKDISIIFFDSRLRISDRFYLRDRLEHININGLIADLYDKGSIDKKLIWKSNPDLIISGRIFMQDALLAGGMLIIASLDYSDNEFDTSRDLLKETLFIKEPQRPNWLSSLSGRACYYAVIKNGSMIYSNTEIGFPVPQIYYKISTGTGTESGTDIKKIHNEYYRSFWFMEEGRPLLLLFIGDHSPLYFIYLFIINLSICLISILPFLFFIILLPVLRTIDIRSLRTGTGGAIIVLSLLPLLLLFYILQTTLKMHFDTYNLNRTQSLAVKIRRDISSEISSRSENMLSSRILSDLIGSSIHHESLERYLFSHYRDTPVVEISIRYNDDPVYEMLDHGLLFYDAGTETTGGNLDYFIYERGLFLRVLKRYRNIEANIVFKLTEEFIKTISNKYQVDIGFASDKGIIKISTFQHAISSGLIKESYAYSMAPHELTAILDKIGNTRYLVCHSKIDQSVYMVLFEQYAPAHILIKVRRVITVIFSLVAFIVVLVIIKADGFIAENIRSFKLKIDQIKKEKIKRINTKEVFISEFAEIVHMLNSLLASVEKSHIITNTLINNIPFAILLLDPDNNVIHSNRTYNEILPEIKGELLSFIRDDSINTYLFKQDQIQPFKVYKFDKYSISLNKDSKAKLVTISNITGILELEEAKLRANLAEKFAHDIKNPLMPIKLYIQHLLKVYNKDRSKFEESFDKITASIISQIDIIENILLIYSKSKKSKIKAEKRWTVHQIFQNLKDAFIFCEENISISFILEDPDKNIMIDRVDFFNIMSNLIRNSIESIEDSGTIEIRQSIKGNDLVVTIKDNGSGMPETLLNMIQKEGVISQKSGGFGIGLKLVNEFVERSKGDIRISSGKEGTTVSILLPDKIK